MLGKAMRFATKCALAFAICGRANRSEGHLSNERNVASTLLPKPTSKTSWFSSLERLAAILALGSAVTPADSFAPPHVQPVRVFQKDSNTAFAPIQPNNPSINFPFDADPSWKDFNVLEAVAEAGSNEKAKDASSAHGERGRSSPGAIAALRAAPSNSDGPYAAIIDRRKRLVVFDFDQTIAREHMWDKYKNAPIDTVPVDDDIFVDLPAFRTFVDLTLEQGHSVAVATFGRRQVVEKAMRYALGKDHSIVISTPADHPKPQDNLEFQPSSRRFSISPSFSPLSVLLRGMCPEGSALLGDKNRQLASLADKFYVPAAQITFLDDDSHNVEEAAKAGVKAAHTPSGATAAILDRVAKELGILSVTSSD